jgi:hypothetical protein
MDWMNQLDGLLRQYAGAGPAAQPQQTPPPAVEDDFDQLTQAAPPSAVADGLAAAFRSEQTPPFGQMTAQLFERSDGTQRASILTTLLRTLGPTILAQVLKGRGGAASGGGALGGVLDSILGGGGEVTPEMAEQIPPDAVRDIAEQAEQRDPSIVDKLSDIYARNPTLIKVLGSAALAIAMAQIAKRRQ